MALLVVAAAFAAVRAPLWSGEPQLFPDSAGYAGPASAIQAAPSRLVPERFSIWGPRGPTYTTTLALVYTLAGGRDDRLVVVVQVLFGATTAVLLFALGWLALRSPWAGLLLAVPAALSVELAVWERSILSETLAVFLVVLSVSVGALIIHRPRPAAWQLLALGLVLGALALCKHSFGGYWLAFGVGLALAQVSLGAPPGGQARRAYVRRFARTMTLVCAVPLAAVLLWCYANWQSSGWFTFSTLSGFNLARITTTFFELAPGSTCQQMAPVWVGARDVLLRSNAHLARTVYEARTPLGWAGGDLSDIELQQALTSCAIGAILSRPDLYLQAVGTSANEFWQRADYASTVPIVGLHASLARAEELGLPWLRAAFFLATAEAIVTLLFLRTIAERRLPAPPARPDALNAVLLLALATAWYGFAVASTTEWGETMRYRSAVQPAIVAVTVLGHASLLQALWTIVQSQNVSRATDAEADGQPPTV